MGSKHDIFPKASRIPDFMQVFDGSQPEISADERALVAAGFTSLVEDCMLANITGITQERISPAATINILDVTGRSGDTVWDATFQDPSRRLLGKAVSLRFYDRQGQEREEYMYSLDGDGTVRRQDFGDDKADAAEETDAPANLGHEALQELVARGDSLSLDGDLEEIGGENTQPISLHELEGLAAMLTADGVHSGRASA